MKMASAIFCVSEVGKPNRARGTIGEKRRGVGGNK